MSREEVQALLEAPRYLPHRLDPSHFRSRNFLASRTSMTEGSACWQLLSSLR
jgi:hypothetical protein